jgi:hypothetical protein
MMIGTLLEELGRASDGDQRLRRLADDGLLSAVQLASMRQGRAVFVLFAEAITTPAAVVKVDHDPRYRPRLLAEHSALRALHDLLAVAGSVPEPLGLAVSARRVALAQSGLPGTPLNLLMRRRPRSARRYGEADHRLVLEWLARLHAGPSPGTTVLRSATVRELVERGVGRAPGAVRFAREVRGMGAVFGDVELPLLPGHGDLGTTNLLVDGDAVGVCDWEGGGGARPPLADIVVFLNHYGRALPTPAYRLPARLDAFRATFVDDGWLARLSARSLARQLDHVGLDAEAAEYLFLATVADLAAGSAPTAHAGSTTRFWTSALKTYAEQRARAPLAHAGASFRA